MRSQFVNQQAPEWAEGLPADVIQTVRQEAIRTGVRPVDLVKDWTLKAAKAFTTVPALPAPVDPSLNASPTVEDEP